MGVDEPMDPRCNARRALRILRMKRYARISSKATAKKPNTASKAIAQCGKSLVGLLLDNGDPLDEVGCWVLPEADAVDKVEDIDSSDLADAVDTDETDASELLT